MREYSIEFNPEAEQELLEVYEYIFVELGSPISAERIVDGIMEACYRLRLFPKATPIRIELMGKAFRYTHFGNYTIAYEVDDAHDVVTIYDISYSGEINTAEMLEKYPDKTDFRREVTNIIRENLYG